MQIDFYVLGETSGQQSLLFACRLLEKMHQKQQRVYVYTQSQEEAERLDNLLWTYRDDSFLPHNLYHPEGKEAFPPSIQIGFHEAPAYHDHVLLNLSTSLPHFFTQFRQVVEIVFSDPLVQQLARERYRQYREHGFEIQTHKLKVNEA